MAETAKKTRARRIASDEAHAWARHLKLKNTVAKFILCMLTLYVDGDGYCFVAIPTLADDTELSPQTVRTKLAWLENLGVIARVPQWIDESGVRNSQARGRRTSDNIRLMIDLDQVAIEARATQNKNTREVSEDDADDVDPQNVTVSGFEGQDSCPSALPSSCPSALPSGLPSDSVEGLISEPEPEPEPESPPPPSGGVSEPGDDLEVRESEQFVEFWRSYPGHEVMERYRALEVFVTMTEEEQLHARCAAPLLAATLDKLKRKPRDAHKWLAAKGWQEYPQAKLPAKSAVPQRRLIKSAKLHAVRVALKIAGLRPPSTITTTSEDDGRVTDGMFWGREVTPDLLAMAPFDADQSSFEIVTEGTGQFAAWRERLKVWVGAVEPQRIWLESFQPEIHGLPGSDPKFKPRKSTTGFRVPTPFPPTVDGKLSAARPPDE